MVQYELAKEIQKREGIVAQEELVRVSGLSKGAVDAQLRKLVKKGYIEEAESGTEYYSDISDRELEKIKPLTIEEIRDHQ
jgi:Fic family protein